MIAKAPLRSGKTDEGRLLIGVEVRNLSATRKVDYVGWTRDGMARGARLTDNFGNVYKPLPVGRVSAAGPHPPMSIYPSKSGREVLAFEPPIAKAEFLRIELSAVAFGKDDVVRLTIPAKMITPAVGLDRAERRDAVRFRRCLREIRQEGPRAPGRARPKATSASAKATHRRKARRPTICSVRWSFPGRPECLPDPARQLCRLPKTFQDYRRRREAVQFASFFLAIFLNLFLTSRESSGI